MNKLAHIIDTAQTSIHELADQLDVDVLEIAMAKRSIGFTHYDTVCALAEALECDVEQIYPPLADYIDVFDEEGISMDEMRSRMMSEEHLPILMNLGIDPDPARWFIIIKLKSGNEVRYRVSSPEMDMIKHSMETAEDASGFFVFSADCRTIVLRKTAIREVQLRNEARYARFSSAEDANRLTIVSTTAPRPEVIEVEPDLPQAGPDACPITKMVEKAGNGQPIGPFFKIEDEGDDRYINLDEMEILEIPLGLMLPHLYEYDIPEEFSGEDVPLEYMTPAGSA